MSRSDDVAATSGPGALALDEHLDAAIGAAPAKRWHPRPAHAHRAEQAPLDQVAARAEGDHWHLVTYGLTEIDAKESNDPAVSGWGFELGIRVQREEGDDEPPDWAADLLTNLAVYVWTSSHPFAPGHHVALGGPIRVGTSSDLTAALIVADPVVRPFDGPFGTVEVLHVVGVTADELELCRSWSTEGVADLLTRRDPALVTRLARASILDEPDVRAEADRRAQLDGASLTELRVGTVEVDRKRGRGTVVTFGAGAAEALGPALRRELVGPGARFALVGDAATVVFAIGPAGWQPTGAGMEVQVPLEAVGDLARLFDGRTGWGRRPELTGLRFHVIP